MDKKEFIENMAVAGGFSYEVAEGVYKIFIETLRMSLLAGERKIFLPELGKFERKMIESDAKLGKITLIFEPSIDLLFVLNE